MKMCMTWPASASKIEFISGDFSPTIQDDQLRKISTAIASRQSLELLDRGGVHVGFGPDLLALAMIRFEK